MTHDAPGYGLWTVVVLNSALFLIFAFSFFKPQTECERRCRVTTRTNTSGRCL